MRVSTRKKDVRDVLRDVRDVLPDSVLKQLGEMWYTKKGKENIMFLAVDEMNEALTSYLIKKLKTEKYGKESV